MVDSFGQMYRGPDQMGQPKEALGGHLVRTSRSLSCSVRGGNVCGQTEGVPL
jgi:hypothetical protein